MMQEKDFIDAIAAYGGKPENWPEDKRDAMLAFRAATSHAEALMGREERLDDWLDSLLPRAPQALQEQLEADMREALATPPIAMSLRPRHRSQPAFVSAVTALAACFIGGFIAAPLVVDMLTGGADLMASLDILSDAFLPIEPL